MAFDFCVAGDLKIKKITTYALTIFKIKRKRRDKKDRNKNLKRTHTQCNDREGKQLSATNFMK